MSKKSPCLSCKHKNVYEPLTKCFVCNFSGIECKNFEMYKPNSQTNADRIRDMTDEELAKFVCNITSCEECSKHKVGICINEGDNWLDWLKQEAKE